jgi:hypothetical protein
VLSTTPGETVECRGTFAECRPHGHAHLVCGPLSLLISHPARRNARMTSLSRIAVATHGSLPGLNDDIKPGLIRPCSDSGVPIENLARLVGHAGGSAVTETVYRKQIRPYSWRAPRRWTAFLAALQDRVPTDRGLELLKRDESYERCQGRF